MNVKQWMKKVQKKSNGSKSVKWRKQVSRREKKK